MTLADYRARLAVRPASTAIIQLVSALPYGMTPRKLVNETLVDLMNVYGWTLRVDDGIAMVIDGDLGEHYEDVVATLQRIGAPTACEYAARARTICGGVVPTDEMERANLTERIDPELTALDREYRGRVDEEPATALLARLSADIAASYAHVMAPAKP